jgi:thiamine-phosphate pyrophosphorylase
MTEAVASGVRFFQYRDKGGTRREIYETALRLARIAREAGALFIVNDHADIAFAVDADGAHLGQDDLPAAEARKILGPGKLLGISTHSEKEAIEAGSAGADYIGFGSIFPTGTKETVMLQGTAGLTAVKLVVAVPVIAIGGINLGNVSEVVRAGADGVAVISAVLAAPDMKVASEELVSAFEAAKNGIRQRGGKP